MSWVFASSAVLSCDVFHTTVSETLASTTLGVQSGVRIRGVGYDDLQHMCTPRAHNVIATKSLATHAANPQSLLVVSLLGM